jgi:hypothetical protein
MENRNPPGKERGRNHDPNRSNAAERLMKNTRTNDKNAHKLQHWNTKDRVHTIKRKWTLKYPQ